jgi:hypothetical protein
MGNDKNKEEIEKGFVVKDKRFSAPKDVEENVQPKEEKKKEDPSEETMSEQEGPYPEINFINFLFSLSTSVLIQLGDIQDPITKQPSKNLPLAKQTIDLIGMLQEKTKGNLTPDEEKFLEHILYDLRMRYVKLTS